MIKNNINYKKNHIINIQVLLNYILHKEIQERKRKTYILHCMKKKNDGENKKKIKSKNEM